MNIPIIGTGPNQAAIKMVEDLLGHMRSGALISVAVVAEQRGGGTLKSFSCESPMQAEALRGAVATLGTMLDLKLIEPGKR